jgi:hypothetical protein
MAAKASYEGEEMTITDLMPDVSQEAIDEAAVIPVVQAFDYYYAMHGPEKADGLLAGLINYKKQLDENEVSIQ